MIPGTPQNRTASHVFDQSYEVITAVGRGRNSVVYRARKIATSRSPERIVALKVLLGSSKQPEMNEKRMRREALAMLAARHPNVIKVCDYLQNGEICYLAMEFAEKGDLQAILQHRGAPFDVKTALSYISQVLSGLSAVHGAGIIHRDVKPENLLVTADGKVMIADFGVSLMPVHGLSFEEANLGIGTFDYLAPESLEKSVSDERTDLYSVAVTCYQLLTSHFPFDANSFAAQVNEKLAGNVLPIARFVPDSPPLLDDLLRVALANDPQRRFQTADQFSLAIKAFLQNEWTPGSTAENVTSPKPAPARERGERPQILPAEPIYPARRPRGAHIEREDGNSEPYADVFGEEPERRPRVRTRAATLTFRRRSNLELLFSPKLSVALALLALLLFWLATEKQAARTRKPTEVAKIEGAKVDGVKRVNARPKTRTFVAATPAAVLLTKPFIGQLNNFLADGTNVPFVVTPLSADRVLVALGLVGWQPLTGEARDLLENGEVVISGGGYRLALRLDADEPGTGPTLRGEYTDLITGQEGTWIATVR